MKKNFEKYFTEKYSYEDGWANGTGRGCGSLSGCGIVINEKTGKGVGGSSQNDFMAGNKFGVGSSNGPTENYGNCCGDSFGNGRCFGNEIGFYGRERNRI